MSKSVDLIIPLADKVSRFEDKELRYCLRSFARFGRHLGRVIVATNEPREWLRDVVWCRCMDDRTDCKDSNIIAKLIAGITKAQTTKVCWTCDDCALLRPVDLAEIPPIANDRGRAFFQSIEDKKKSKWQRRMLRTFDEVKRMRVEAHCRMVGDFGCNFDTHTPQVYNAVELLEALEVAMERTGGDVCVNTWASYYVGRDYDLGGGGCVMQDGVKVNLEKREDCEGAKWEGRVFLGYNDAGWRFGNLEGRLGEMFAEPCGFEAEGEGWKGEAVK